LCFGNGMFKQKSWQRFTISFWAWDSVYWNILQQKKTSFLSRL